jgi:YjbE family integral membrane protein
MTLPTGPMLIADLTALAQVLLIDLVLAGDNAVVVGLAVAGLPPADRRRAIAAGIAAATVLRIGLAGVTLSLLDIIGLALAGGLLLLWVCWRMFRELRHKPKAETVVPAQKTLGAAMLQIALADISMSLDNVLAVAGAARSHPWVLVVGLALSVVLMGVAANFIARLLEQWRWISWVGLLIVTYVAVKMIWDGTLQVRHALAF